ncbi:MAG: hypothetical protein NT154_13060 [Verrucomicrobia bacterium]|nr:hypothetical protein [Verrucomicrobiota bacterium]
MVNIADDGSWSADFIPPGAYGLSIKARKEDSQPWEMPAASGSARVVVPEGTTPQKQIKVEEVVLRTGGT